MYKSKPKLVQVKLVKLQDHSIMYFFRSVLDSRVDNENYAMF